VKLFLSWYRKVYSVYHFENCIRLLPKAIFLILASTVLLPNKLAFTAQIEEDKFAPVYATVLADKVNIRAGCGLNFELLAQLNESSETVVFGQKYGWYKIKLPTQAFCFVHKDYVKDGVVRANKLRVRAGPGSSFNILGVLKEGRKVNVLKQEGDWWRIAAPPEASGWVKKDYLRLSNKRFMPAKSKPVNSDQKIIEALGTIDDLGKIINRPGTHKLTEGKEILYYLKSVDIDLNLYVYQKVCVIGKLIVVENVPYPVLKVEQIKAEQCF